MGIVRKLSAIGKGLLRLTLIGGAVGATLIALDAMFLKDVDRIDG